MTQAPIAPQRAAVRWNLRTSHLTGCFDALLVEEERLQLVGESDAVAILHTARRRVASLLEREGLRVQGPSRV